MDEVNKIEGNIGNRGVFIQGKQGNQAIYSQFSRVGN